MSKKLIFVTIPMLRREDLKKIEYRAEGQKFTPSKSSFPSLPMIEWNVNKNDDVKLYVIMTDDDNQRTKDNYEEFKKELQELKDVKNLDNLQISGIIKLPHEETKAKQVQLFQQISKFYENDSDIYMDITYGTKATSIGLFSSLVFAEKLKNCNIKSIVYGKFTHNDSGAGELYDLRSLYEISRLVNAVDYMAADKVEQLINSLWG